MRKETVRGREMYDDVTTEEMISVLKQAPSRDNVAHKQHINFNSVITLAVALVDVVEAAGARHNWSKLHSALAVAALQCCSSKIDSMIVKNQLYIYI